MMAPLAIEPLGGIWGRGAAGAFAILLLLARSCDNPRRGGAEGQVLAGRAKQPKGEERSRASPWCLVK
jgi:hypothetical protein